MYRGDTVFVFTGQHDTGTYYRFGVLVCFDWVANVQGLKPWRAVVDDLAHRATDVKGEFSLSWMFIIQHNPRPSHETFMCEVNDFFDPNVAASVRRERTCLVFANSAGRPDPGRIDDYGHSSLIFAQQTLFKMPTCHVTFCSGGRRFRGHGVIRHHKDFLFRERGACIHSFKQLNPDVILPGASGYTIAVQDPFVYPVGDQSDPRRPGNVVPASVKWLNDELDTIESVAQRYSDSPLAPCAKNTYEHVTRALRSFGGNSVDEAVALACSAAKCACNRGDTERRPTADDWDTTQRAAVVHLIDTVSILAIVADSYFVAQTASHASMAFGDLEFDVVAIRGKSHVSCGKHYRTALPGGRRPVLLVSRDTDNIGWSKRLGSFLQNRGSANRSQRNFTRPHVVSWQIGYRNILDMFRDAQTVDEAKESFDEELRR